MVRNGPWVYTGEGGYWVLIDPDVLAQEGIVSESNGISQVSEEIYTNPDNWVDVKEDPNWTEDGDYVFSSGELGDVTGGEAAEGDVSEEEELSLIDILNTSSSESLGQVIKSVIDSDDGDDGDAGDGEGDGDGDGDGGDDGAADNGDKGDEGDLGDDSDEGDLGDDSDEGDLGDDSDEGDLGDDGDEGDGEGDGDGRRRRRRNGDGDGDGDGNGDGDGDGDGSGGLGLSGGGMFSLEAPSIFEPSYKPLDYDTQLLKPRMFDFIDYNPLRNIR